MYHSKKKVRYQQNHTEIDNVNFCHYVVHALVIH